MSYSKSFDASPYEVSQRAATSKDGTKIPYFLVGKKDLDLDSKNPTLLYGYGGFSISQTPCFNTVFAFWLQVRYLKI